jgi:hypothetical protein
MHSSRGASRAPACTLPLLVCALPLLAACGAEPAPSPGGPRVAIDVAALNLTGVADACWTITVKNGAGTPETVFTRTVSSSRYGDGAGSASYVGPCDADPAVANNTVTVELLGLYAGTVADCSAPPASVDFQNPGTLSRSFVCRANEDVAVNFNVSLMRPAQQGFFDIAVNFGDIFCSAKVDCCADDDDNGVCDRDIDLLYSASGRDSTVVVGFACASGDTTTDTFLYLDPLTIVCGGTTVASITPEGQGNLCDPQTGACTNVTDGLDLLFQVGVYRGKEQLAGVDKVYWNLALGMNKANFPSGQDCRLRFRGTADDDASDGTEPGEIPGAQGGVIADGDVYPIVTADVLLSSAEAGPWACTKNPLNVPGSGVTTVYTPPGGTVIPYCYDPENACGSPSCSCGARECGVDNCGNPCGTCAGDAVCDAAGACVACQPFTASFETDPTADGWIIVDGYPNADDTHDGSTRWIAPAGAEDGFVRLTEEFGSERGTMYHPTQTIPAGDASIGFDFRITDGGVGGSADGLAFSIVAVAAGHTIDEVIAGTGAGGGIGYENGPELGNLFTAAVTVEIDTYLNTGEAATPHLAVHRDLDSYPSGTLDQVPLPGVVDGAWHQGRVDIVGATLRIYIDGLLQLESTPANMPSFAGGHMFFSSSTGGEYDVHDIDAVDILGGCGGGGGGTPVTAFTDDFNDGTLAPAWEEFFFPLPVETGGTICSDGTSRAVALTVDPSQDSYTFWQDVTTDTAAPWVAQVVGLTAAGDIYYMGIDQGTGGTHDAVIGVTAATGPDAEWVRDVTPFATVVGATYRIIGTFTKDAGAGGGSLALEIRQDPAGADSLVYANSHTLVAPLVLDRMALAFGLSVGQTCVDQTALTSTP